MPELVSIPIAIFEIIIDYSRPSVMLMMDRKDVVSELFDSLRSWDVKVDDVEVIKEGKPSEQGIKFKLPARRVVFFFGPAFCKLTRDDADWESAEETIKILDRCLNVVTKVGKVEIGGYKATIALHLQPKTLPFIELLKPLAPPKVAALDSSPVKAAATVVKWEKRRITIDGSGQLANGVFLRLEREFEATATYQEIASQLKLDEDQLFDLLGVKEG